MNEQKHLELLHRTRSLAGSKILVQDFTGAAETLREMAAYLDVTADLVQSDTTGVLLQGHSSTVPGMLVQSARQILTAGSYDEKTGVLRISGVATVGDCVNNNGEVYPLAIWKADLPRLNSLITQGRLVGESEHPRDGRTSLERTCMKMTKLWLDGAKLMFEADLMPTSTGVNVQTLVKAGIPVAISSRGNGKTQTTTWRGKDGVKVVQPGFQCHGFDCVISGASPGAGITSWGTQ